MDPWIALLLRKEEPKVQIKAASNEISASFPFATVSPLPHVGDSAPTLAVFYRFCLGVLTRPLPKILRTFY